MEKFTPLNHYGAGLPHYLWRHFVHCGNHQMLTMFKAEVNSDLRHNRFRYHYKCCSTSTKCSSMKTLVNRYTPVGKYLTALNKQSVFCENSYLNAFRLRSVGLFKEKSYQYSCCSTNGASTCRSFSTPAVYSQKSRTFILARLKVECPKGFGISQFRLNKVTPRKYAYNYKCCKNIG